jgi:RimJ/RimL family protein N-acetyltransferase
VGTSSLGDVDLVNERVHLGWTMYGSRWWGTEVNPEAKLLLLGHAFEALRCASVGFHTSTLNLASRAAIARLGAREEGILRQHLLHRDGSLRDTVCFSILDREWPAVKAGLRAKLDAHAHG